MTLNDTYYLSRTGRYNNPLNSNDRLPIVYGDLTDGTSGNWILPCIDTVNHVYCYAAHEVLSVADGNSVSIYKDGVLVDPGDYVFDESDNYEFEGTIAKITFSTDQGNAVISARGKGKASSGKLISNIVDILYDFLTVENAWTAGDFDATKKAAASQTFQSKLYIAAGVVHQDIQIWALLAQMMGSFLGTVYLDGNGLICLEIDDGVTSETDRVAIIPKRNTNFISATQLLDNLINQCPASYGYDYVNDNDFKYHTDDSTHGDAVSQAIYGIRKPSEPYRFYWCRDLTTVHAVQDVIVGKYKNGVWEVIFENIARMAVHVDVGDIIAATIDRLYDENGLQYTNHLWRVLAVAPDYQSAKIKFTAQDTGYYMYASYLADGSYIADGSIHAGSDRDITEY